MQERFFFRRAIVWNLLWLVLGACGDPVGTSLEEGGRADSAASFAGMEACAGCHAAQVAAWRGSHHDRAMQEARSDTVLGDFSGVAFEQDGSHSQFFEHDGRYFVRTEGPGGESDEFAVAYTFGVEPLQQYLVSLPDGRLQALTVAWDSRPAEEGGQRWFSLRPDEATPPGDVLHWTGPGNRWNTQCADCHSTNLRKNFDAAANSYDTTWSEIDVACEACHGPASQHIDWAQHGAAADANNGLVVDLAADRGAKWQMEPSRGIARRVPPRQDHAELNMCARCHSRRSVLSEDVFDGGFLDSHIPAFLNEGLYYADGQIDDEVYVYGSFVQSRMFAAGVTCSDCHDPHSLKLRGTTESVCAQCHLPERFATPAHHHHEPGSEGARCVSCHMPERTYMQVDARRDHSFRIPRPDLSRELGTPNACSHCHADRASDRENDRGSDWATDQIREWRGDAVVAGHFGEVLAAGRSGAAGSSAALASLAQDRETPAIARATALTLLASSGSADLLGAIDHAVGDPDPLLRIAAARAAESIPPALRSTAVGALLRDPVRSVRIEAGRVLAGAPTEGMNAQDNRALGSALAEYRASQLLHADSPQSHVNLALLHLAQGDPERAEEAYRRALSVGDYFIPAYVNLADLYRATGRDERAEPLLREALERSPESAEVHQALGLLLVRMGRSDESLREIEAAARLAPEQPRFAYIHGIALHSAGRTNDAVDVLSAAHRRHPADLQLIGALATMHRDLRQFEEALGYAHALEKRMPGDESVRRLRQELEAAAASR